MELRQLRYFVRIVDLGSVSRAAADVFVAQPALSQQMASLEADLGVKLLARSVRGVTPTEAGRVFYRHAQTALRLMERIREDVQRIDASPSGLVSVGLPISVANVIAAPLIAATRKRYPDIQLKIIEGMSGNLEDMLVNGRVEMALLFDRHPVGGARTRSRRLEAAHLNVRPLLQEELFLLTAGTRRFGKPVTLAEAASMPFVLPAQANKTRKIIQEAFATAGLEPEVIAEVDSLSTILSVVAAGIGATILSTSILAGASDRAGITARRIADRPLFRLVSLCTYEILALNSAAECILDLINEVARTLVSDGTWVGVTLLDGGLLDKANDPAPASTSRRRA